MQILTTTDAADDGLAEAHSLDIWEHPQTDTPLLHEFLKQFSLLPSLQRCEEFHYCNSKLCPRCSGRSAARAQRDYAEIVNQHEDALALTLTIEDVERLSDGFDRLDLVLRTFTKTLRADPRVEHYVVSIEITDTAPRWHVHAHAVIFGTRLDDLADGALEAWLIAASAHGIPAHRYAQHAAHWSPQEALLYALKAKVTGGSHGLLETLRRASDGDADALDRWTKIEEFYLDNPRRRWRTSWRMTARTASAERLSEKPSPPTDYSTSADLRRLVLLDCLGVTSRRQQAEVLHTAGHPLSTATISRMRRSPLMVGRTAP